MQEQQFKVKVWSPDSQHKDDRVRWGFGNHYFDLKEDAVQFARQHAHGYVNATIYERRPEPVVISGNLSTWLQLGAVIGADNFREAEYTL